AHRSCAAGGVHGRGRPVQGLIRSKKRFTVSSQPLARGLCLSPPALVDSSKRRSSSFCSSVRETGVSTTTRAYRSPWRRSRTVVTPLLRSRKTFPDCVPGGILSETCPSSVGRSTSPPRATVAKLTGTSQERSAPLRVNSLWGLTRISTYRSPGGPPFRPASPSPARRIRSPSSTPGGILTDSFLTLATRPRPWHLPQGVVMTVPAPLHAGQVCWMEKNPCCIRTWPTPPQVAHETGSVPGSAPLPLQVSQVTCVGTSMVT